MKKDNMEYKHPEKEAAPAGSRKRKLLWILFAQLILAVLLGSVVLGMTYGDRASDPGETAASEKQEAGQETGTSDDSQEEAKTSDTGQEKAGTEKDKTYKVFIETGHGIDEHGEWDPGCSWSDGTETYEEAKIMIPVAQAMAKYLRRSGVEVYTDAETGNGQNLMATLP